MRQLYAILFLLIAVTAFSQNKKSSKGDYVVSAFHQKLDAALNLVASEQYENAELAFKALLISDPTIADVNYYYGETILKDYYSDTLSNSMREMILKAEDLFKKGIEKDSLNKLNEVGLGAVKLILTGDTVAADKHFKKAEASLPVKAKSLTQKDARLLTKLGYSQFLNEKVIRYKKALNYLNRAKEISPEDPLIYLAMGDLYLIKNDGKNALASYNKALSLNPKSPLPKIKIGNIYIRAGNLNAARPYLDEARGIDSTFAPVYRELGELYTMAGQFNLAKSNFRKFLDLSGNNIPAKIQYAKALFRSKDYTTALTTIEEILAVDKSRNYLNRLAGYCCYDKKPAELLKGKMYLEEFFKNADPSSIIPRDFLYYSRTLYKVSNKDSVTLSQAFAAFEKAYALDTNNVSLASEIASNYYYSRSYGKAILWINLKNQRGRVDKDDMMLIGKSYYQLKEYRNA